MTTSLVLTFNAEGGIRTHEANARDLKTRPFDHSGTPAESIDNNSSRSSSELQRLYALGGFRSRDLVLIVEMK